MRSCVVKPVYVSFRFQAKLNEYEFPVKKVANVQSQLSRLIEKNYYLNKSAREVSEKRNVPSLPVELFLGTDFWYVLRFFFRGRLFYRHSAKGTYHSTIRGKCRWIWSRRESISGVEGHRRRRARAPLVAELVAACGLEIR